MRVYTAQKKYVALRETVCYCLSIEYGKVGESDGYDTCCPCGMRIGGGYYVSGVGCRKETDLIQTGESN